jgi:nitroimidazol reductase NimA-like FMN-containing flavoprotein (pyridoxamine 5'-phosphate oxidase superfamily)
MGFVTGRDSWPWRDRSYDMKVDTMPTDAGESVKVLDETTCLELLSDHDLGRVAFANGRFPMILPVNYTCFDGLVVFRTDVGVKLENIAMSPVAFEIDGVTPTHAWSVVVLGHAREVTTALGPRYEGLREAQINVLAPGTKTHWIAIEVYEMSGRSFPTARHQPAAPVVPQQA